MFHPIQYMHLCPLGLSSTRTVPVLLSFVGQKQFIRSQGTMMRTHRDSYVNDIYASAPDYWRNARLSGPHFSDSDDTDHRRNSNVGDDSVTLFSDNAVSHG
jgi:hypothetical protein